MDLLRIQTLLNVVIIVVGMIIIIISEQLSIGAALVTDDLLAPPAKLLVGAAIIYSATSSNPTQDNLLDFVSRVLNVCMVIILPLLLWYVFSSDPREEEITMIESPLWRLLLRFLVFLRRVAVSEYNNLRFIESPYIRGYKIFSGYITWGVIFSIAFSSIFNLNALSGSLIAIVYAVVGIALSMMDVPQLVRNRL